MLLRWATYMLLNNWIAYIYGLPKISTRLLSRLLAATMNCCNLSHLISSATFLLQDHGIVNVSDFNPLSLTNCDKGRSGWRDTTAAFTFRILVVPLRLLGLSLVSPWNALWITISWQILESLVYHRPWCCIVEFFVCLLFVLFILSGQKVLLFSLQAGK